MILRMGDRYVPDGVPIIAYSPGDLMIVKLSEALRYVNRCVIIRNDIIRFV